MVLEFQHVDFIRTKIHGLIDALLLEKEHPLNLLRDFTILSINMHIFQCLSINTSTSVVSSMNYPLTRGGFTF